MRRWIEKAVMGSGDGDGYRDVSDWGFTGIVYK